MNRGNIGKSGIGGGIRMAQIDERTKVRVSQTLKKNLQKQQAWGGASTVRRRGEVSGTASSVAFTPLQVNYLQTNVHSYVDVNSFVKGYNSS